MFFIEWVLENIDGLYTCCIKTITN